MNKTISNIIFWVALLSVYAIYNYQDIIYLRPQSIHQWRQADCLSLTQRYFDDNLSLFTPKTHNLLGDGKTVGEFPIIYYLTAKLYHVFGNKEFILRLVNVFIFSWGLFYLKKTFELLTKDFFYSTAAPLLLLTSAVVAYYNFNFLTDLSAFGIMFMSIYGFAKYFISKNTKDLIAPILIITLVGLLKITALFPLPAIFLLILFTEFRDKNVFKKLSLFLIPFAINIFWIAYAKSYQAESGNKYFILNFTPIWLKDAEYRERVWDRLSHDFGWLPDYFHPSFWIIFALAFLLLIIKEKWHFRIFILSTFITLVAYFLLMYYQFYHHDYYALPILLFAGIVISIGFYKLENIFPKYAWIIKIGFIVIFIIGLLHTNKIMNKRYFQFTGNDFTAYYDIEPILQQNGIDKTSKILNLSDFTYCESLYLMNRLGWTNLYLGKDDINQEIINKKNEGCSHLIVHANDKIKQNIDSIYTKNLIFEHQYIQIYKLP